MAFNLHPFRINSDGLPKFVLRAKDGHWFEFYRREIESKWEEAEQANFDE